VCNFLRLSNDDAWFLVFVVFSTACGWRRRMLSTCMRAKSGNPAGLLHATRNGAHRRVKKCAN
jgi:hypothetical protein